MGYATYLTASPFTLDRYYRTEDEADARITAAAAENPAVTLSKTGDITLDNDAEFGRWTWDSANSEFVPPDTPEDDQRRDWKFQLAEAARKVDDGLHSHWAQSTKVDSKFEEAGTVATAQKVNNTFDWARQAVGLAWLEILKLERDATALALMLGNSEIDARTHSEVQTDVNTFLAELSLHPTRPVAYWIEIHDTPAAWRTALDARTVYTTNTDGTPTRYGGDRYASIPEATWQEIVNTYYHAALRWSLGIGVT